MTRVEDSREPTGALAFAERHVEPILAGEKTLTARYDFERDLRPGQVIALETPSGKRFATARVTAVETESVAAFVKAQYSGHRTYETVEAFLEEMRTYYPESNLHEETLLTRVEYTDVSRWER